jgi:ATP-dependent DNA ligase
MAVTAGAGRAKELSHSWCQILKESFKIWMSSPHTRRAITQSLYHLKDDGSVEQTYFSVVEKDDKVLLIRTIVPSGGNGLEYGSTINPTKTLTAKQRILTTIEQKATKLLRKGWAETLREARELSPEKLRLPMKLHKYAGDEKQKIKFPCVAQPKIDGIFAIYEEGRLYSRDGLLIDLPHITQSLMDIGAAPFNGEIAYDDWTIPLPEVIHGISEKDEGLRFHIFDSLTDATNPFSERHIAKVNGYLSPQGVGRCWCVRIVDIKIMYSHDDIDAYYQRAVGVRMEGVVVRNLDSVYEFGKRSHYALKYKWEIEEKFLIEGYSVVPHPDGDLVMFICTHNGKTFEVVPAWKHDERRECLAEMSAVFAPDLHVGGLPTILVEYRGITPDGKPYHAVGKTSWSQLKGKMIGKK